MPYGDDISARIFYCYGAFGSSSSNRGKNRWPCGLPFNVVSGKVFCQKWYIYFLIIVVLHSLTIFVFFFHFFHLCRYLCVLKSYVRNRAHPEGSIAEAHLADGCMTFCSRYIDGFATKHNRPSRNDDDDEAVDVEQGSTLFPSVGKPLGKPGNYVLRGMTKFQAHRYVLFNCSDVNPFLR